MRREFECFFNFLGWWCWSLGIHIDPLHPHLDIHLPFGFFRIGWYCEDLALWRCRHRPAKAFGRWDVMADVEKETDQGCSLAADKENS